MKKEYLGRTLVLLGMLSLCCGCSRPQPPHEMTIYFWTNGRGNTAICTWIKGGYCAFNNGDTCPPKECTLASSWPVLVTQFEPEDVAYMKSGELVYAPQVRRPNL